jgi:hypothetical protein
MNSTPALLFLNPAYSFAMANINYPLPSPKDNRVRKSLATPFSAGQNLTEARKIEVNPESWTSNK